MQPGATIQPGSTPTEPEEPQNTSAAQPQQPAAQPVPVTAPLSPEQPMPVDPTAQAPEPQWYAADEAAGQAPVDDSPTVQWRASEYIAHSKGTGWFMLVVVGALVLAALVYLLTRELISAVVLGVIGIAFAFFGARPPQVLDYLIDGTGLHIGQRFYAYNIFRSFSVLQEGAARSILLMPVQRFGLPITIYYDPKDELQIVDVLGANLPHEEREVPPIDRLMSKIRF